MIQHSVMVQTLMERTVLADIQSTRSDRGWDQNGKGNGIPQKVRRFMYMNNCTVNALRTTGVRGEFDPSLSNAYLLGLAFVGFVVFKALCWVPASFYASTRPAKQSKGLLRS